MKKKRKEKKMRLYHRFDSLGERKKMESYTPQKLDHMQLDT